jgi:hypothetical protein
MLNVQHREIIADIELTNDDDGDDALDAVFGAHHSCSFLIPQYAGDGNSTSVIYEYDYKSKNAPEKTSTSFFGL